MEDRADRVDETPPHREQRIRKWIGGQLRQPGCRVPAPVWNRLAADGQLTDVLEVREDEGTKQALLEVARSYLRNHRAEIHREKVSRRRSHRTTPTQDAVKTQIHLSECLSEKEIKRAQVLSSEMVRIAEKRTWVGPEPWSSPDRPVVAQFRDRVLAGKMISEAKAQQLLTSVGAAMFEIEFFEANHIPVLAHLSELTSGFDWSASDSRQGLTPRSEITFQWAEEPFIARLEDRAREVRPSEYPFHPNWRFQESMFAISRNSVLGWLSDIASLLTFSFPWDRQAAVMFVLTGARPLTIPIDVGIPEYSRGQDHSLMRLELTVHPWVSAEAVLEVYKRLQRIVVGPRNRAPEVGSLEFYDFVSRHRHEGNGFRETLEAWLAAHPRDRKRYPKKDKTSLNRFTNQFRDIERQVLRPFGRPDGKEVEL